MASPPEDALWSTCSHAIATNLGRMDGSTASGRAGSLGAIPGRMVARAPPRGPTIGSSGPGWFSRKGSRALAIGPNGVAKSATHRPASRFVPGSSRDSSALATRVVFPTPVSPPIVTIRRDPPRDAAIALSMAISSSWRPTKFAGAVNPSVLETTTAASTGAPRWSATPGLVSAATNAEREVTPSLR